MACACIQLADAVLDCGHCRIFGCPTHPFAFSSCPFIRRCFTARQIGVYETTGNHTRFVYDTGMGNRNFFRVYVYCGNFHRTWSSRKNNQSYPTYSRYCKFYRRQSWGLFGRPYWLTSNDCNLPSLTDCSLNSFFDLRFIPLFRWCCSSRYCFCGTTLGSQYPAQQHRLMDLSGKAAGISLSLHASFLYLGSALGSILGGLVIQNGSVTYIGYFGGGSVLIGLIIFGASVRVASKKAVAG